MNKYVSVILPAYNSEKFIKRSIQSILDQTFKKYELIIVLDKSIDKTKEIIESFKDQRIKLIEKKRKTNLADALNLGISKSRTNFIARADSDDIYSRYRIENQFNFLKQNKNIDILGSAVKVKTKKISFNLSFPTTDEAIKWAMSYSCPMAHPSIMFRKNSLKKIKFYNPNAVYEDYDLYFRGFNHLHYHNLPNTYTTIIDREDSLYKKNFKFVEREIRAYQNFNKKINNLNIPKNIIYLLIYKKFKNKNIKSINRTLLTIEKIYKKKDNPNKEIKNLKISLITNILLKNMEYFLFLKKFKLFFKLNKFFIIKILIDLFKKYAKKNI